MEFTSIAKHHSIYKRLCFVHAKQSEALLLNFYMGNTLVRSEFHPGPTVLDAVMVQQEQKPAEGKGSSTAALCAPSSPYSAPTIHSSYQESWL